jgi:hypothetical protein
MSQVLKFPAKLQNQAFKCLAVANATKTKVEVDKGEDCSTVSLTIEPGVEIIGSGPICKYLIDIESSLDLNAQSVVIQWISFVDSELR